MCYLRCFGFEEGPKIDGYDTVKKMIPNETSVYIFLSCMAFCCCSSSLIPTELKTALKIPSTNRSSLKSRQTKPSENESLLANEINNIKEILISIKNTTESYNTKIELLSTKTDANEIVGRLDEIGPEVITNGNRSLLIMQKLDSEERRNAFQNSRNLANELFKRPGKNFVPNDTNALNQTPKQHTYATVLQKKM